jgi:hypothetical protein
MRLRTIAEQLIGLPDWYRISAASNCRFIREALLIRSVTGRGASGFVFPPALERA